MFTITVHTRFNASHSVQIGRAPREAPHNHDWLVEVELGAPQIDRHDLVADFHRVERLLDECLRDFNGALLDELPDFAGVNPSAERLAEAVFKRLSARLPDEPCTLLRATVWETDTCAATYRP
jgi:6-pyruvoyltetrahydropterin/6-carboxytetrahydropterin synthase